MQFGASSNTVYLTHFNEASGAIAKMLLFNLTTLMLVATSGFPQIWFGIYTDPQKSGMSFYPQSSPLSSINLSDTPFTVSFWLKTTDPGSKGQYPNSMSNILSFHQVEALDIGLQSPQNSNRISVIALDANNMFQYYRSARNISDGNWHLVTFISNPSLVIAS